MSVPSRGSRGVIARTQHWYSPNNDEGSFVPVVSAAAPFDPALLDDDWDLDGQERLGAYGYNYASLETGAEYVPIPGLTVATVDQDAGLWQEQPGQEASLAQRWFAPDAEQTPPLLPPLFIIDPATLDDDTDDDAQQYRDLTQRWYQPDTEAFVPQPPAVAFDPATMPLGNGDETQQLRPFGHATVPTWEAGGEKLPATPPDQLGGGVGRTWTPFHLLQTYIDPAGGSSALASVSLYRSVPDPTSPFSTAVLVGTAAAGVQSIDDYFGDVADYGSDIQSNFGYWFIATNAEGLTGPVRNLSGQHGPTAPGDQGVFWNDNFGYGADQDRDQTQRRFAPDPEWSPTATGDGPAPPVYSPALVDWGNGSEALPSTGQRWFAPDAAFEAFVPTVSTFTTATVIEQTPLWIDQTVQQLPLPWLFADNLIGIDSTPAFDTAVIDFGWDAQQDRSTAVSWFAPEESEWHQTATGDGPGPGGFNPALMDYGRDPQQDRSTQATWFAPDATFDGFVPIVAAFNPATVPQADETQQFRDQTQRWFAPDPQADGFVPIPTPTTATVPQQAELWQDQSGQQDRSLAQRWVHPDDDWFAQQPSIPLYVPPTVDQLGALWQEQPYPEGGNAQRWYHPSVEPVDGVLSDWFSPGGGGGTPAPAVLIDATTGDVFLYIGGNFIIPAS